MKTITNKHTFKNISSLPTGNEIELLRQQLNNQQALNDFAKELLNLKSVEEVVWSITENVIARLNLVDCIVYIVDDQEKTLIQRAAYGPKNPTPKEIEGRIEITIGKGIVGTVALTGKAEIIADTRLDNRYIPDDQIRLSEIAVPIILDNKIIGVIDSEHPKANFFNEFHLESLTVLASLSAASIKNAIYHEELKREKDLLKIEVGDRINDIKIAMDELQRSNDALRNYAHVVSHDLKQPLRSINSFIGLIERTEKGLSKKSLEYFKFITNGTVQMQKTLNGLLEYSKVSDTKLNNKNVDLNQLLIDVKNSLSTQIAETKATIISDELPSILGFETLLHQLFQNIISNSIKFRQKEVKPLIKISYKKSDETHYFSMTDNGIGMKDDQNHTVFNLFTRLHSSDDFEGTGLGLSFCKKIIERHHGEITISSPGANKGCTLEFSIRDIPNIDL